MSRIPFAELPDHARLWVFPASRPLSPEDRDRVSRTVEDSLAAWNAHGSAVHWGYELVRDQFLVIGVDETHTALSGCSIDACTRQIRSLEKELNLDFLDSSRVFYRDGDRPAWLSRPAFRERVVAGDLGLDTVIFNNVLATVGEFRSGGWEVPARDSWHARAFPFAS